MSKIEKANKMLRDIQSKIDSWNERSQFTLKGVHNLSRSDMDSIIMYGTAIINFGNYSCYMEPRCEVRDVLCAYGLASKDGDES